MTDIPIMPLYSMSDNAVRTVNRRWGYYTTDNPQSPEVEQIDTRVTFELLSDTSTGNETIPRIVHFDKHNAAVVFTTRHEHPFLVDMEYDYYPTRRASHNYVRIENDPVNMLSDTAPTTEADGYAEAAYIIGSVRYGYHRRVEHIGGTPRISTVYDITNSGWTGKFPKFPPQPATFATPDRYFLRTTDMGYVHYIKSTYHDTNNEALEVKDTTGLKTWIWDKTTMTRGATLPGDLTSNVNVKVKDVVTLENAALNSIHTGLNDKWMPDDKTWEIYNIPGRASIKVSDTIVSITQYDTDHSTVKGQFLMTLGGTTVIKSAGNTVTLGAANGSVVITDGTLSITMNGSTVDVS